MTRLGILAAFIAAMGISTAVRANSVTFTTPSGQHDSDGPILATVEFDPVNGGILMTVTNTETGTFGIGQAVSSVSFAVSGISSPTAFTMLSGVVFTPGDEGTTWTLASGAIFSDTWNGTPPDVIDHWGFSTSGSTLVATAGSPVSGGSPTDLILPSSGTVGPGMSLNGNHVPDLIGPTQFLLTVPGVTTSTVLTATTFSNVIVGFGTGPDSSQTVTGPPVVVGGPTPTPLPASVWSGFVLVGGLAGVRALAARRRQSTNI